VVPVCTVPSSQDRIRRCKKVDAVRLHASYRLNLLLLKRQIKAAIKHSGKDRENKRIIKIKL